MEFEKVAPLLGSWAEKFKYFIESEEFDKIFAFLKQQTREGRVICPEHKNVFRAFQETPFDNLKAIFILQDPYPWIKKGVFVADGIPMSCSNNNELQPSLSLFYDGMEENLGKKVGRNADLTYLCNQGVLILNTSLTVELNKPTSHSGVWDKFMEYLFIEVINFYTRGLVYVSFGKSAHVKAKAIVPFLHWGFEVEHPAAAAHRMRKWDHEDIFTKINILLKNANNEEIIWNYNEYVLHLENKRQEDIKLGNVKTEV